MLEKAKQILKQYWGYDDFRPDQKRVVSSILEKKDTLALLPTGGGKSICYQVPGLLQDGIVIVISPLIALMNDQVSALKERKIPAISINSNMGFKEVLIALENTIYGKYKFLYVSPERVAGELFQQKLADMNVAFFAIDEAHCISQWGFDFRPSYLKLNILREIKPEAPILALTASAPPKVVTDIYEYLNLKSTQFIQGDFERKNLSYYFIKTDNKDNRIKQILTKNKNASSIVYGYTRKDAREFSKWLSKNGLPSNFYHGGLTYEEREKARLSWMDNTFPIMCATNAFGMGIDKPDVKFVLHQNLPLSIDAYYQEAGRAGRNGQKAWAITLFNDSDLIDLKHRLKLSFPEIKEIKRVYKSLSSIYNLAPGTGKNRSFPFEIGAFCQRYNLKPITVFSSIKFLEKEGLVNLSDSARTPSKIHIRVSQQELYSYGIRDKFIGKTIEILLRSYSGLFDDYGTINETLLAQRIQIERQQVVKHFRLLAKMKLIVYHEQTDSPWIFFSEEILTESNLRISPENYHHLKKLAEDRLDTFIELLTETTTCRNQMLMDYFGIKNTKECGICDVCLANRKAKYSGEKYEKITRQIITLSEQRAAYGKMIETFPENEREDATEVISFLRDEGKI